MIYKISLDSTGQFEENLFGLSDESNAFSDALNK